MSTFLIIGLGNPGEKFCGSRHNIGREIAEAAVKHFGLADFTFEKKYNARVANGKVATDTIVVTCPDTFMNKSGSAAALLTRFFKVKPDHIFIIHDDTDLELGNTKLSFGKHSAGHKGVESIIRSLKTRDFWRLRVGVGAKKHKEAEKIILKKFTSEEMRLVKKVFKKTFAALDLVFSEGPEKAMNEYNKNS